MLRWENQTKIITLVLAVLINFIDRGNVFMKSIYGYERIIPFMVLTLNYLITFSCFGIFRGIEIVIETKKFNKQRREMFDNCIHCSLLLITVFILYLSQQEGWSFWNYEIIKTFTLQILFLSGLNALYGLLTMLRIKRVQDSQGHPINEIKGV